MFSLLQYIPTTRGTLTDVLLSPTSCTQKDVAKLGEFVSVKDLNEKCPPPGDDVKPVSSVLYSPRTALS